MLYEAKGVKTLALGLMLIASRGWLRASEARIGLDFRFRAQICHQLDPLHSLADLLGFGKEEWDWEASGAHVGLGFRFQAMTCCKFNCSHHSADLLGFKTKQLGCVCTFLTCKALSVDSCLGAVFVSPMLAGTAIFCFVSSWFCRVAFWLQASFF